MWTLSTRNYVVTCILLIGCMYLLAALGQLRLFLIFVALGSILFIVTTFLFAGGVILEILPAELRARHAGQPLRYYVFLLISILVGFVACIFSQSMAHQQGVAYALSLAGILAFSIFVFWNLVSGIKAKPLIAGSLCMVAYLSIVAGWASAYKKIPQDPSREELAALPYVAYVSEEKTGGKTGVTVHREGEASPGFNLYAPNTLSEAFLTDMNGNVLHTWKNPEGWELWAHVALNDNGDLLAIYKDHRLTRLSWDSRVIWRYRGRFHHDARFAESGDIYALSRKDELVIHRYLPVPVLNDYIVILSPDGQLKKEYSLLEYLKEYVTPSSIFGIYRYLLQPRRLAQLVMKVIKGKEILFSQRSPFDVFHTNSVEPVEGPNRMFQEGDLLISMRNISLVAVLNPQKGILWKSNQFTMQHHPSFLPNGNILVFDNGLPSTGSRVAELDPQTKQIVWEYKAHDFYAYNRGGTQCLPNGNILITESPDGRAFEVTQKGEIVWEFFTPKTRTGKRSVIYRLMRHSGLDGHSKLENALKVSTN